MKSYPVTAFPRILGGLAGTSLTIHLTVLTLPSRFPSFLLLKSRFVVVKSSRSMTTLETLTNHVDNTCMKAMVDENYCLQNNSSDEDLNCFAINGVLSLVLFSYETVPTFWTSSLG